MGSDRQSIALHENGKKHREAVEEDLKRRRDEKSKKEKDKKDLESVFAKVNAAVGVSVGSAASNNFGTVKPWEYPAHQILTSAHRGPTQAVVPPAILSKKEKCAAIPAIKPTSTVTKPNEPPKPVDPIAGKYELDGTTYLEGTTYAKVLEEGMPIQLWMGSAAATNGEKRDLRNYNHWKMALLAKVVKKRGTEISCYVSYLKDSTDEDETLESNVSPSRIRLVLGSDPSIPSTMEEAHLALMGGEQTIHISSADNNNDAATANKALPSIDEHTGLSGWSTTTIRKVSSHYEQNQEKKRKRNHEKELAEYQEKKAKEIQARKMEEAKYANAHDSALGAYDVWSSSTPGVGGKARAYKGVDINKETKVEVADTAKSLSKGMGNVGFKKKKLKKKKNVRRTSADDD